MAEDGTTLFQTRAIDSYMNGRKGVLYQNGNESPSFLVQLEDMSLHFLPTNKGAGLPLRHQWSREEALSGITQVELMESENEGESSTQDFQYVRDWDQKVSLAGVLQRVIQRYVENFSYLAKYLFSTT